jgi:hypothetical protein
MNRIDQYRRQDLLNQRSRWWRDGIACGLIGAFIGLLFSYIGSVGSLWMIATWSIGLGVLGAIFGDRVLLWCKWL